ncbi:MAG: DAK2 domain-containing protein [Chloroflexi bacterium]|nr:DAK2 domain-containing protein [Chloroflexota bacterium]
MTDTLQRTNNPTAWSGDALLGMFTAAAQVLESHVNLVNRLNVFPVQDGDTGINMLLTLRDTLEEARSAETDTAEAVARAMWDGACMGAKGNGGSIVSQLFKGMSEAFDGKASVSSDDLAAALSLAKGHAYNAIGNPVEGTMLTVFTYAADAATQSKESGVPAEDMLSNISDAARDAVNLTPSLLPRLQEAGVVDSGGLGLWMILEGVRRWVADDDTSPDELDMPLPEGIDVSETGVSLEFLDLTEDEEYGNCTQFVIRGERLDVDSVRTEMSTRGRSAVVIGDASLVKVHVHTEVPDEILSYARGLGSVSRVSVENMDEQRERLAARQRQEVEDALAQVIPIPVLAVAWGEGLEAVFRHEGASVMVAGDTMNPSVREILDAVDSVPSESVIILPNNGNILPAAQQAAEAAEKTVRVVSTTTIPQGVAAILEFQPYRSIGENAAEMENVIREVRTGEITRAARSVTLDGISAEEGELIGLFERQLVAAGRSLPETTLSILRSAGIGDGDLVTLYRGDPVSEAEADDVVSELESAFPSIDLQHYYGGQPFYHFIVSIE